tara:strand:+ start:118 stop:291 length:174 start_codon:yes stop_codon:yes gene_type:complete
MMETKELYKGDETVVVDAGSDAEKYWKGQGYSEEKAKPKKRVSLRGKKSESKADEDK